jgi:hypothetical protein
VNLKYNIYLLERYTEEKYVIKKTVIPKYCQEKKCLIPTLARPRKEGSENNLVYTASPRPV